VSRLVQLFCTNAAERRTQVTTTLLMLIGLAFFVPWWVVLLAGAASFTVIILRPSIRTLELANVGDGLHELGSAEESEVFHEG
jgi:hypothetical protein